MSDLILDSGIDTFSDLRGILPPSVRGRVTDELLRDAWSAAALRVLATIRDSRWHDTVGAVRIDWDALTVLAREGNLSSSGYLRVAFALSLGRRHGPHLDMFDLCRALDEPNFWAVIDAMRIAREGLES